MKRAIYLDEAQRKLARDCFEYIRLRIDYRVGLTNENRPAAIDRLGLMRMDSDIIALSVLFDEPAKGDASEDE